MTKSHRLGAAFATTVVLVVLGACKNDEVDLGGGASAPPTVAGKWRGYMEGSARGSADDDVHLDLAVDGDKLTGVVTFTTAPPPPPVGTDKDAAYPPDAYGPGKPADAYRRGFRFTVRDGATDGVRARFWIFFGEVFAGWCGLQPPYLLDFGRYGCLPGRVTVRCTESGIEEYDEQGKLVATASFFRAGACGGLDQCRLNNVAFVKPYPDDALVAVGYACECDVKGCRARTSDLKPDSEFTARAFDLNVNGDRLDGAGFHFVRE